MARRVTPKTEPTSTTQAAATRAPEVLVVHPGRVQRELWAAQLSGRGMACVAVSTARQAQVLLAQRDFDAALIAAALPDDRPGTGAALIAEWTRAGVDMSCVLAAGQLSIDAAVEALRVGACDVVDETLDADELAHRLKNAAERTRGLRERVAVDAARNRKLRRLCRRLNESRHELSQQVTALCGDMTAACHEMADQLATVGMASEFKCLIGQELDVESLLRTALEYTLARTGPTNAAIFLPASTGDYSLGAYVNYDKARDTAEVMLDHLADVLPERFEEDEGAVNITTAQELEERLGDASHWLEDHTLLTYTCRWKGETLAVVAFFRERGLPFTEATVRVVDTLGALFAAQLARVIRVHHRMIGKNKAADWREDEPGLAA